MAKANKLLAVVKREYLERVRTKWFLIASVFGPIFFLAIMFVPAWLSIRAMKGAKVENVVILDASGAGLGERVKAKLDALGRAGADTSAAARAAAPPSTETATHVQVVAPTGLAAAEDAALKDVMQNRASAYLVLDSATAAGHAARYAGRNASSLGENERVERAIEQAVLASRLEAAGLDPKHIDSLTKVNVDLRTERVTDRGKSKGGAGTAIFALMIAFLLYMMIILYGQNIMRGVMEEKQTRVAEVVVSSVKPDILLAGKVLGVGAVGLTQQAIWIGLSSVLGSLVGPMLAKMREAAGPAAAPAGGASVMSQFLPEVSIGMILLLVAFFVLGYIFYSSLFASVGAMVNSEQEAQQALQPVMILLVASALFIQPVAFNPTGTLAKVVSMLPFSAPIIMPMRMAITSVPPLEVAVAVGGLIVGCFAAVWVAARIYRVGLLMYGKRPSMAELVKWIRYA